jgi:putative exosortase-associated protein (TIGR04073 family)
MKLPRWTFTTLLALILAGMGTSAWAADSTAERIALKAARGVDNTLLGLVAELPKTMYYQSQEHGLPYGMTVGAFQGIAVGLTRTGVGLYELATFPVPVPPGYQPILSPQFSLEPQETRIAQ